MSEPTCFLAGPYNVPVNVHCGKCKVATGATYGGMLLAGISGIMTLIMALQGDLQGINVLKVVIPATVLVASLLAITMAIIFMIRHHLSQSQPIETN